MKSTIDTQQFGQLRARLQATFSEPALIVITSATRGDGKTATAYGLAESLADANLRVLLVDANPDAPVLPRYHTPPGPGQPDFARLSRYAKPVANQRFLGISLADDRLEMGTSMDQIRAAAVDMRAHFDFVIIDTAPLLNSDLAVLFAAISEGTFLALRLGRLPSEADAVTVKTLSHVGASALGVLTVTPSMIKKFANWRAEVSKTYIVPARHVTTRHTIEPDPVRDIVESPPRVVSP
jgi:Mrp family chromosome partitioning ATPase